MWRSWRGFRTEIGFRVQASGFGKFPSLCTETPVPEIGVFGFDTGPVRKNLLVPQAGGYSSQVIPAGPVPAKPGSGNPG